MTGFTKELGSIRRWQAIMTDQPLEAVCANRISMLHMRKQVRSSAWERGDKMVKRGRARTETIKGLLDADAGLRITDEDLKRHS